MRRETAGWDMIRGPGGTQELDQTLAARRHLLSAQVHYKFGLAEFGNVQAFDAALASLREAERHLVGTAAGKTQPTQTLSIALNSLRMDVTAARSVAAGKLAGAYPLIRGFGIDLVDDEDLVVHSHPVPGVAQREAVFEACRKLSESAPYEPIHAIVLVPGENVTERESHPWTQLVDAESHLALEAVPHLTVYPGPLRAHIDPMPAWDAPDSAFDAICRQFLTHVENPEEPHGVMVTMVREFSDAAGELHWVQAQYRAFSASTLSKAKESPEDLEADRTRVAEALARDKCQHNLPILGGLGLLFLLAWLGYRFALRRQVHHPVGWQNQAVIPVAGFLVGLIVAPLVVFAMGRTLPHVQTDAVLGAWWPCFAGALTIILPAAVFRLCMGSLGRFVPFLSCHGRWGIALAPVALGITGAWMWAGFYALGTSVWPFVIAAGIAATSLVYAFGRGIDVADEFPTAFVPLVALLTLLFGGGAFLGSAAVLCFVTLLVAALMASRKWMLRAQWNAEPPAAAPASEHRTSPRTLESLKAALAAPLYQPSPEYLQLSARLEQPSDERCRWIGIVGPSGSGKSAMVRQLIADARQKEPATKALLGHCAQDGGPYHPFREALADLGVPTAFITSRMQGGGMTGMLDRLADEFIPFWDFISGYQSDDDNGEDDESSRGELFEAVTNALHSLARQQPIVLSLDDVQWIDEGSVALLKHLKERFCVGPGAPPLMVLTGRDRDLCDALGIADDVVETTLPSPSLQARILESSLGIQRNSARRLMEAMGVLGQQAEGMFWLLRSVQELAQSNGFLTTSRGFVLQKQYLGKGQIPAPQAMRKRLAETLKASSEYRSIIECAALLGEEFRVDELAECLKMDRLELLIALRRLEQEFQLVWDLPRNQECYAFSSAFLLDLVREELGVGGGSGDRAPSKIARELHRRIATVLEARRPRTPELAYRIARHFHRAGNLCAEKSRDACRHASRIARSRLEFHEARRFVSMAEQSARRMGDPADFSLDRALIAAYEAKVTGRHSAAACAALRAALALQNDAVQARHQALAETLSRRAAEESEEPTLAHA